MHDICSECSGDDDNPFKCKNLPSAATRTQTWAVSARIDISAIISEKTAMEDQAPMIAHAVSLPEMVELVGEACNCSMLPDLVPPTAALKYSFP